MHARSFFSLLASKAQIRAAPRRAALLLHDREASQSRRANRITWTVPVPTAVGLDVKALPEPPSERERGEDQRSRHVRQGARRIAVASFNGIPQVGGRELGDGGAWRCRRVKGYTWLLSVCWLLLLFKRPGSSLGNLTQAWFFCRRVWILGLGFGLRSPPVYFTAKLISAA